jgi:hypothetical protein
MIITLPFEFKGNMAGAGAAAGYQEAFALDNYCGSAIIEMP